MTSAARKVDEVSVTKVSGSLVIAESLLNRDEEALVAVTELSFVVEAVSGVAVVEADIESVCEALVDVVFETTVDDSATCEMELRPSSPASISVGDVPATSEAVAFSLL